jgi:hypothetical protein
MSSGLVQAYNVKRVGTDHYQNPDDADTVSETLLSLNHLTWLSARGILLYTEQHSVGRKIQKATFKTVINSCRK